MQLILESVGFVLLALLVGVPCIYGLHMYFLLGLTLWHRRPQRRRHAETINTFRATAQPTDWPIVTTQIPLYNELPVARRVIEAVAAIDYPPGRHQIQVLDDSNDATCDEVDAVVRELRLAGVDIEVIRRSDRHHFKAGALQHGLHRARGEYVAVFDADFMPGRDFLNNLIPLIIADPKACCVQGRWGHVNREESWITQGLSLGIDGHFGVEQPGRAWGGYLLNFNGTAGIWRRAAIDDPSVGGWDGDTLTEDLDLSYRAQMAGWRIIYHVDELAPAEIPADPNALKTQQRRWATGSIQCARKLLGRVWTCPRLSIAQKLEGTIHLCGYAVNVMMLLMALFGRPLAALLDGGPGSIAMAGLVMSISTAGPILAYFYARWSFGAITSPLSVLRILLLGLGLAVNNSVAVVYGLVTRGGEFVRTPKSGHVSDFNAALTAQITSQQAARRAGPLGGARQRMKSMPSYAAIRSRLWVFELLAGVLCVGQWALFVPIDGVINSAFLLLYGLGFLVLGWASRPQRGEPKLAATIPAAELPFPAIRESAA